MGWGLIEHRVVSAAQENFTGLAGNDDLLAVARLITASVAGARMVQASIDNGANYLGAVGDYISSDVAGASGTPTNVANIVLHSGSVTTACSGAALLSCLKLPTDKTVDRMNRIDARHLIIPASAGMGANDVDAIRFATTNTGNLLVGDIWLYGRASAKPLDLLEARTVDGVEEWTGLGAYDEIVLLADEIAANAAGSRTVQVGHGSGPTWLTAIGDYKNINGDGTESNQSSVGFHKTGTALARGGIISIFGFNLAGAHKIVQRHTRDDVRTAVIENLNALTAVRVTDTLGAPTAGMAYLYGRRA